MSKKNSTELLEVLRILDKNFIYGISVTLEFSLLLEEKYTSTLTLLGNNISLMSVAQVNRVTIVR